MKKSLLVAIPMSLACIVSASAVTTAFTPSVLSQFGAAPGPTIDGAGLITLTQAVNGLNNAVGFDRTDVGSYPTAVFSFTSRIAAPVTPSADGYTFGFAPTSLNGITGAGLNVGEEGNFAGGLGISFDTWNNTGPDPGPDGSDLQEIAVHFNGARVLGVLDTRLLTVPLTLDDGVAHAVTGTVNFAGGTLSMSVDGQSIFSNVVIPGLVPYESRIFFSGRTGGENELVEIGGLNVAFVPEPAAALLSLLGVFGILRRRR